MTLAGKCSSKELNKLLVKENTERRVRFGGKVMNGNLNSVKELYIDNEQVADHEKPNPATGIIPAPRALGGPLFNHEAGKDTRVKLADWLTARDNPYFARSFVNRVSAHYFGVGLVNPVDDFSVANPPTNPRLLDAVASRLRGKRFRHPQAGADDPGEPDVPAELPRQCLEQVRQEQLFARLHPAADGGAGRRCAQLHLGVEETFPDDPPAGTKMVEVGASRLSNPNLAFVLRVFGRPPRAAACDCERTAEPVLTQTLYRMTDEALLQKIADPKGRARRLLQSGRGSEEVIEELFLATLSRYPSPQEKSAAADHLAAAGTDLKARTRALNLTFWALINTREFILNH